MNSDDTQQSEFPNEWEGVAGAVLTEGDIWVGQLVV